ncbi:hypothetical protein Sgleb_24730 [Streptomyces glebosus]|uniref:Uncharacterized protein n=2 Tax=Streptomyces glebosus TaxID=249580 RepID=A0A640SWG8_9ACTN|nr:hypothetical protein Sgleb_24730 [Streptomyces glebosus]
MDQQNRYQSIMAEGWELANRLNAGMAAIGIGLAALGDVPSGTTARVRLGSVDEATAKQLLAVAEAARSEDAQEER